MDSDGKFETCLSSEEGRGRRRRRNGWRGGDGRGRRREDGGEGRRREGREDETEGVITGRRRCERKVL